MQALIFYILLKLSVRFICRFNLPADSYILSSLLFGVRTSCRLSLPIPLSKLRFDISFYTRETWASAEFWLCDSLKPHRNRCGFFLCFLFGLPSPFGIFILKDSLFRLFPSAFMFIIFISYSLNLFAEGSAFYGNQKIPPSASRRRL